MNRQRWMVAVAALAIVSPCALSAQIVIDGTDADDHGSFSAYTRSNQDGWKYMQRVVENMAPQVRNGNRTIVSLGTEFYGHGYGAGDAISSAFGYSTLATSAYSASVIGG